MRELWLVHPTDQVVTVYEQGADGFGRPTISEMRGELAARVLPAVVIDWGRVLAYPP